MSQRPRHKDKNPTCGRKCTYSGHVKSDGWAQDVQSMQVYSGRRHVWSHQPSLPPSSLSPSLLLPLPFLPLLHLHRRSGGRPWRVTDGSIAQNAWSSTSRQCGRAAVRRIIIFASASNRYWRMQVLWDSAVLRHSSTSEFTHGIGPVMQRVLSAKAVFYESYKRESYSSQFTTLPSPTFLVKFELKSTCRVFQRVPETPPNRKFPHRLTIIERWKTKRK